MNTEQERAEFEVWFTKTKAYISDPKDIFAQIVRDIAWEAWQARAALQSQERDALLDQHHRDSKELRRLCTQRDAARKVSKEAGAVIAALKAERDTLREALEVMVEMIEMKGFGFHYAMDLARAALGRGQEEA